MIFGLFGRKKERKVEGVPVGVVIHYFSHIKVAVIKVETESMGIGDHIRIKGHTTDFEEKIKSMQVQQETVKSASKGHEVAINVKKKVRRGDHVFLIRAGG